MMKNIISNLIYFWIVQSEEGMRGWGLEDAVTVAGVVDASGNHEVAVGVEGDNHGTGTLHEAVRVGHAVVVSQHPLVRLVRLTANHSVAAHHSHHPHQQHSQPTSTNHFWLFLLFYILTADKTRMAICWQTQFWRSGDWLTNKQTNQRLLCSNFRIQRSKFKSFSAQFGSFRPEAW